MLPFTRKFGDKTQDKYIKAFFSSSESSEDYLHQVGDNRTGVWYA